MTFASRPQHFLYHFRGQLALIRSEVASYSNGTITGYKGNTTGVRSRKKVRQYAREQARQLMKADRRQP